MNTHGRWSTRWLAAALLAIALTPRDAAAFGITSFRDLVDPVPPGGTIVYKIGVNPFGEGVGTFCFNPEAECITSPATCFTTPVDCVGNSFTGFVCVNSLNDGTDCGVGDPPVPDFSLCTPNPAGVCSGGLNAGRPCTSLLDCPGNTFVCEHAYNEGAFCGTGNPPAPDSSLCIPNPGGVCNGGPNFGQPCDAPHGVPTEQCPPDDGGGTGIDTVVSMAIPPATTFLSADMGGTSDGAFVTWELPSEPCAGPGGISGTPLCPQLTAEVSVSSSTPVGTVIQSTATATDPGGTFSTRNTSTTVGTFNLLKFRMVYPTKGDRDGLTYRALFTLNPGATISPPAEIFRMQMDTASGPILDLQLAPGQLRKIADGKWGFTSREPGFSSIRLEERAPSHYRLKLRASRMELPAPPEPDVVITLTFGNDILSQPLSLLELRGGKKYVGIG